MSKSDLDDLTYFAPFTLKGEWWALGNARHKVSGTLRVGECSLRSNWPRNPKKWQISIEHPKPFVVSLPKQKVQIEIVSIGTSNISIDRASLTQQYVIRLTRPGGLSWKRFHHFNIGLQNLMMLLAGDSLRVRQLGGFNEVPVMRPLTKASRGARAVTTFRMFAVEHPANHDSIHTAQMLFPLVSIKSQFEEVCQKWFGSMKRNRGIYDVFFTTMRGKHQYLETRFFNLAQCLEAFHRKWIAKGGGKFLTPRKFTAVRGRIEAKLPTRLPKGIREAVGRVLHQANEYSFLERLESLFSLLEPETVALITDDPLTFRRAVRDTRNLFTHLEPRKKSRAFKKSQWLDAIKKMQMLLVIHFLKLCGFSEAQIRPRLEYSQRFDTDPLKYGASPATPDEL